MANILDNLKYQFKSGGMYIKLIFINVIVFVAFGLIATIAALMQWDDLFANGSVFTPTQWFSFSSDPGLFFSRPWSIITYMFVHGGFMHLLMNMLIFFFMGKMLEQYLGTKKTLSIYVLGGIFGALIYFGAHNIFPLLSEKGHVPMVGASASVMAILAAIATYAPNVEVHVFGAIKVKLYIIAILYGLIDLMSLGSGDGTAHFAHLGGALWGFIYISQFKKGKDMATWFDKLMSRIVGIFKKAPKIRVAHSKYRKPKKTKKSPSKKTPPRDDKDYNSQKIDKQAHLDAILDKIKVGGYECLSVSEKNFLSEF
jgi:membrane associated rhomboid family serine protease